MAPAATAAALLQALLPTPNPLPRSQNYSPLLRQCCNNVLEAAPSSGNQAASPWLSSPLLKNHALARSGIISNQSFVRSASLASEPFVRDDVAEPSSNASKRVLVIGGTGGVGQLVLAGLLDRGYAISAVLRDVNKAKAIFGEANLEKINVILSDTRNMEKLDPSVFEGVTHVICCTGTTAFPSKRWDGDNTPENTDWHGVRNLIDALPKTLQRIVLVSSVGVTKYNQLPWSIMNLFGVLKYKKMAEDYLRNSGIPYTIIRPGRLTDGPYTSYDLNTLLKATAGTRRSAIIGQGDKLVGEASRIIVAEACIQALDIGCTCWNAYEINSIEGGDGPGKDKKLWEELFNRAHTV